MSFLQQEDEESWTIASRDPVHTYSTVLASFHRIEFFYGRHRYCRCRIGIKQQQKLTTTGPLPGKYTDPPNKIIHNNNSNSNHESHGRFRIGHSRAHGRGNASLADCRGSTHRYVLLGSYFAYIVMGSVLSLTQRPTGGRVGCVVVSLNLFRSLTRYPFTSVLVMTRAFHHEQIKRTKHNMPCPCNLFQ